MMAGLQEQLLEFINREAAMYTKLDFILKFIFALNIFI